MQVNMQIGKNGLSSGFIDNLKKAFNKYELIKISVLKSGGHEKSRIKEMAENILENLGKNYTCKIVGFTLFIRKWRKAR